MASGRSGRSGRARSWLKAKAAKLKTDGWSSAWRTGVFISAILYGLWTNSIQHQSNAVEKEFLAFKETAATEKTEFKTQLLTVTNKVESCEKRQHDLEMRLEEIHEEAQELPPSPQKRNILRLTKRGKPISRAEPMRANEPLPNPAEFTPRLRGND